MRRLITQRRTAVPGGVDVGREGGAPPRYVRGVSLISSFKAFCRLFSYH